MKSVAQEGRKVKPITPTTPSCFTDRNTSRMEKILQVIRTTGLQPRLLYPAKLSIKIEGQIKSFPDKRSLKESTSTKPTLQEMLKSLIQGKEGKEKERGTQVGKNGNE